jgi:hypothetical protein
MNQGVRCYATEEPRLAVVTESRFSFLFCAKKKKQLTKNPFTKNLPEKFPDCFQLQTVVE